MKPFPLYLLPNELLKTSVVYSIFVQRSRLFESTVVCMASSELTRITGIMRNSINQAVRRLIELGLLERVPSTKIYYKVKLLDENHTTTKN
jgi:hypothetical protein